MHSQSYTSYKKETDDNTSKKSNAEEWRPFLSSSFIWPRFKSAYNITILEKYCKSLKLQTILQLERQTLVIFIFFFFFSFTTKKYGCCNNLYNSETCPLYFHATTKRPWPFPQVIFIPENTLAEIAFGKCLFLFLILGLPNRSIHLLIAVMPDQDAATRTN